MQRQAVNSGELLSVGYDAELQVLEVEFADHSVYQLMNVTVEVYASLMSADDQYGYFDKFIRWEYAGQQV